MKIAVPFADGEVYQHFGHTEQFKLYTAENGKTVSDELLFCEGSGHGALAALLKEHKVEVLICGGIGGGAKEALAKQNIAVYGGVSGQADEAVQAFLEGRLVFDPDVSCSHHDQQKEHSCGNHSCGHSCAGH